MCSIFLITGSESEESESVSEGDTEQEPSTATEEETPEVEVIAHILNSLLLISAFLSI